MPDKQNDAYSKYYDVEQTEQPDWRDYLLVYLLIYGIPLITIFLVCYFIPLWLVVAISLSGGFVVGFRWWIQ